MMWIIYFASMSDRLLSISTLLLFVSSIGIVVCLVFTTYPEDAVRVIARRMLKIPITIVCLATFINIFVPSSTTIYMMLGVNVVETQLESPENQETLGKVRKIIDMKLDDVLNDEEEK